jgi:hypothetical protein
VCEQAVDKFALCEAVFGQMADELLVLEKVAFSCREIVAWLVLGS